MPVPSLLALLDDITSVLDDVAAMTKVAAKQTAGVIADDLALNAEQVAGVRAERELPVIWAVAKGSLINKAILVPLALILSALLPWTIAPLLMVGGFYLCFEGAEKVYQKMVATPASQGDERGGHSSANSDLSEGDKIRGAIRTDFVLSAEIVVLALGTVKTLSLLVQSLVLALVSVCMTFGVYGFVALIVKLDDMGIYLLQKNPKGGLGVFVGRGLLRLAPLLMKSLTVVGTIAMFVVGGGILAHGSSSLILWIEHAQEFVHHLPLGAWLAAVLQTLASLVIGTMAGLVGLLLFKMGKRLRWSF